MNNVILHKLVRNVGEKCVPLAVCDMNFDFLAVMMVCLLMYTFLFSCKASIIWQKTSQTI